MTEQQRLLSTFIINHLNSHGADEIELTTSLILYWFYKVNILVFDGKLSKPYKIKFFQRGKAAAYCDCNYLKRGQRIFLAFNINVIKTKRQLLEVLVHEMVHFYDFAYNAQHQKQGDHGREFFKWRKLINERTTLPLKFNIDV